MGICFQLQPCLSSASSLPRERSEQRGPRRAELALEVDRRQPVGVGVFKASNILSITPLKFRSTSEFQKRNTLNPRERRNASRSRSDRTPVSIPCWPPSISMTVRAPNEAKFDDVAPDRRLPAKVKPERLQFAQLDPQFDFLGRETFAKRARILICQELSPLREPPPDRPSAGHPRERASLASDPALRGGGMRRSCHFPLHGRRFGKAGFICRADASAQGLSSAQAAKRARYLVSRIRSSHHFAASWFANFGFEGTPATYCF